MAKYVEGQYKVRVTNWDFAKAKSGNPYWYYMIRPVELVNPDGSVDDAPNFGERMIRRTFSTAGALSWLESDLKKMGVEPPINLVRLDPQADGGYELEGVELLAECSYKESDQRPGQFFEEWKLVGSGVQVPDRPSPEELEAVLLVAQGNYDATHGTPEPEKPKPVGKRGKK